MVLAIASRKYEPAALSRLFRFTLATVQAEHRSDREVTMWPTPLGVFPNGQFNAPHHCSLSKQPTQDYLSLVND
jgi:hypothetical protein